MDSIGFEDISDPNSPYFDRDWFESDLVPEDSPWFEIIGDFFYRRIFLKKYAYTGRSEIIKERSSLLVEKIKHRLTDLEHCIRYKRDGIELASAISEISVDFESLKALHEKQIKLDKDHLARQKLGKYDRGTDLKKAWYALWVLRGQQLGVNRPLVNRKLAKAIEEVKAGIIPIPEGFDLKFFTKMLHKESTRKNPRLNQALIFLPYSDLGDYALLPDAQSLPDQFKAFLPAYRL